jgi:hypothetical protein
MPSRCLGIFHLLLSIVTVTFSGASDLWTRYALCDPVSLFDRSAVSPSRPAVREGGARRRGQDGPKATAEGGAKRS